MKLASDRASAEVVARLDHKLLTLEQAVSWRREVAALERRLVFTNGVFDLLHAGHVRYLAAAKLVGMRLFVGVNDDASVRRLKGPGRPIQPLADRVEILAGLACVDGIIPFGDDTAEALIAALRPDVYVKGADYAPVGVPTGATDRETPPGGGPGAARALPEADLVRAYGGIVLFAPTLPGRSTSELIARIRAAVT